MQRNDRWPDDYDPEDSKSRPGSRRNSTSLSRRSSVKKEGKKKSPLNSAPSSATSTPKKLVKPQNLDFIVTGKQLLKRGDRANSLPGYRRPSTETVVLKKRPTDVKRPSEVKRPCEVKRACEVKRPSDVRKPIPSQSSKSRETSLEDDVSLDLSQVSDFEDTNSKYGVQNFNPIATSSPKSVPRNFQKSRSASLQSQVQKMEARRSQKERESTFSCSRENSVCKASSATSNYINEMAHLYPRLCPRVLQKRDFCEKSCNEYGVSTELDYSSVSPEYSGQSSAELSPRALREDLPTPRSQDLQLSSCCISSWQSDDKAEDRTDGEWSHFWANYNNSISKVPMKSYYDQCPTPYRTENIDVADLDFSTEGSRKRTPENTQNINSIIRNEGLHLTPRETQNIIKCAHILGNVLTKAIERRSKEKDSNEDKIQELQAEKFDPEVEIKKKTLTLDLKETNLPEEVKEEKRCETVTTQTDISLPNTKSAPRIFEKILKQLSRTSLEESLEKKSLENKENKEIQEEKTEVKENL